MAAWMRAGLEDHTPRKAFHSAQLLAKATVIADSLFHFVELLLGQGDSEGFACYFARPLVACPPSFASGAVLD